MSQRGRSQIRSDSLLFSQQHSLLCFYISFPARGSICSYVIVNNWRSHGSHPPPSPGILLWRSKVRLLQGCSQWLSVSFMLQMSPIGPKQHHTSDLCLHWLPWWLVVSELPWGFPADLQVNKQRRFWSRRKTWSLLTRRQSLRLIGCLSAMSLYWFCFCLKVWFRQIKQV